MSTFGEAVDGRRGPTLTVDRRGALFAKRVRKTMTSSEFFLFVCCLKIGFAPYNLTHSRKAKKRNTLAWVRVVLPCKAIRL